MQEIRREVAKDNPLFFKGWSRLEADGVKAGQSETGRTSKQDRRDKTTYAGNDWRDSGEDRAGSTKEVKYNTTQEERDLQSKTGHDKNRTQETRRAKKMPKSTKETQKNWTKILTATHKGHLKTLSDTPDMTYMNMGLWYFVFRLAFFLQTTTSRISVLVNIKGITVNQHVHRSNCVTDL